MSLTEVCPEHLNEKWETVRNRLRAHHRSLLTSKIDLEEHCFYDMVPEKFLYDFCEVKDKITSWVFQNYERPDNYDFLRALCVLTSDISSHELKLNFQSLNNMRHKSKIRDFIKKYSGKPQYCRYNVFGTKTGRLTTMPNSFPILTMPKDYRRIIEPSNDWFLELDYNAAELRTVLALSGKEQPEKDIHEWNVDNIFKGKLTRDEAKTNIFAWLYGSNNLSTIDGDITATLSEVYRKEEIVRQYWTGTHVRTRFGRSIPSDNHHALSYIIQSSTVDVTLRRFIELDELLRGTDSRVAFTLHDSVVIDLSDSDRHLVPRMVEIFGNTELGRFKTNVSAGRNFGTMSPLRIPQK
tara:strand:+ start:3292 stop:4347 length:1056 start_codon:yes stop_codon:yes gene_type:complete